MASEKGRFDRVGLRPVHLVDMQSHEIKQCSDVNCPGCGAGPMDGVTGLEFTDNPDKRKSGREILPKDGMPTICSYCGELCMFSERDGKLSIVFPSQESIDAWRAEPELWNTLLSLQGKMQELALQGRLRGDRRYAGFKSRRF